MSVMDEENKEQQQNSVSKQIANREIEKGKQAAKNAAKDVAKKAENKAASAVAKGLTSLAGNPYFWIIVAVVVAIIIIFLAVSHFIVQKNQNKTTVDAKKQMMTIAGGIFEIDKTVSEYKYKFKDITDEQKAVIERLLKNRGMNLGNLKDEDGKPIYFDEQELAILYVLLYGNAGDDGSEIDINQSSLDIRQFTEEQLHCLPLFFKAELVTMYPDLGGATMNEKNFQGRVIINRHYSDGSVSTLTYRPKEDFDEWISNNNEVALKHFSLDENNNLWYATKTLTTQVYTYSGYDASEQEDNSAAITLNAVSVPYQDIIRKYTIPFEFLMPILTITEDAEFCTDIANEIIDKTQINLGIYDNVTTVISEYTENVEETYKTQYYSFLNWKYKIEDETKSVNTPLDPPKPYKGYKEENTEEKTKTEVFTTHTTTNIVVVDSANTLFFNMQNSYEISDLPDDMNSDGPNTSDSGNIEEKVEGPTPFGTHPIIKSKIEEKFEEAITEKYNRDYPERELITSSIKLNTDETYTEKFLIKQVVTSSSKVTTQKTEYQNNPGSSFVEFKGKNVDDGFYQRFIKDDDKTKHARSCLLEVKDRLFTMLEENLYDSEIYINIMKYVFYLFTGRDYGVTDIDDLLELYKGDTFIPGFSGVSGNALYDYMRIWENTALYKYYIGETSSCPRYAEGEYYKVFYGGSGDPTYNLAYGIVISRNYNDTYFSAKGVSSETLRSYTTDGQKFEELTGQEIECIFEQMIQKHKDAVLNSVGDLGLEEHQIDALTAIHYQYGNIGNFREAYTKYKDDDIEFQNHFTVTSGKYQPLLVSGTNNKEKRKSTRVEANWKLFKGGIYTGNGYELNVNNYSASGANLTSLEGLNLYNEDGTVNQQQIGILNNKLVTIVESDRSNTNGLTYKQCTWWAAKRADMYLAQYGTKYKKYPKNGAYGNAGEWYNKNKNNGWFDFGSVPRANSLIVWSDGGAGHVGYVEAVDTKNKKIYTSEASNGTSFLGVKARSYTGEGDASYTNGQGVRKKCLGYIYLDSPK